MASKNKKYTCKSCKYNKSGFCTKRNMNKLTTINRCNLKIERNA